MSEDELTVPEAAALLGIDRSVVLRAIGRKSIPARRVGQRLWVMKRDDVEAYATSRKPRPAPPGQGDPKRRPGPKPGKAGGERA